MSDTPDIDSLYRIAESQAGYFTAGQAVAAGMDRSTLRYHSRKGGRYVRAARGLYRLRHFPSSLSEHVVAAWLMLREAGAVVSHESALELYDLSDVIPTAIHLTIPRAKRGQRPREGVFIHTSRLPLDKSELRTIDGVPATSPERTIVDAAEAGTQPEQIELSVRQAIERGLTTAPRLRAASANHSARVQRLIEASLAEIEK